MNRLVIRPLLASAGALLLIVAGTGCQQSASPSSAAVAPQASPADAASPRLPAPTPTAADVPTAVAQVTVEPSEAAEPKAEAKAALSDPSLPAAKPTSRTVAKPVVADYAANVPPVLLSAGHAKLCKLTVGDAFPAIELPKLVGGAATVASFAGKRATVVLFWAPDRWMSRAALADLSMDVAGQASNKEVGLVAIVEGQPTDDGKKVIEDAGGAIPQLVDANGAALAQVGVDSLPRIYVLDAQQKVVWFDIEYSEATRRELQQTLAALTAAQ